MSVQYEISVSDKVGVILPQTDVGFNHPIWIQVRFYFAAVEVPMHISLILAIMIPSKAFKHIN